MQIPIENPIALLEDWLNEAKMNSPLSEPWAMAIATASQSGEIHNRMVLLKSLSEEGITFFTNYSSQKGHDLDSNPQTEAVFYWDNLARQVRIGGSVRKTSREISEQYWNSRARESQLSQWVSLQSSPLDDFAKLESMVNEARAKFDGRDIPCPENWGGYLLEPNRIEFWMGSKSRLHERILCKRTDSTWTSLRLYP